MFNSTSTFKSRDSLSSTETQSRNSPLIWNIPITFYKVTEEITSAASVWLSEDFLKALPWSRARLIALVPERRSTISTWNIENRYHREDLSGFHLLWRWPGVGVLPPYDAFLQLALPRVPLQDNWIRSTLRSGLRHLFDENSTWLKMPTRLTFMIVDFFCLCLLGPLPMSRKATWLPSPEQQLVTARKVSGEFGFGLKTDSNSCGWWANCQNVRSQWEVAS